MKLIYVVRRFGPVGGMERYVWETARELHFLGHEIKILCETSPLEAPQGMVVHKLGRAASHRRWKALANFEKRVRAWLDANPHPGWLIHSHERLSCHHITTYHGQPFATIFQKHWSRWLSWRVVMQLFMERRELSVAKFIVPVSQVSWQQLAHYYPQFAHKLTRPVEPGVTSAVQREPRSVPRDGGVIAFVGKEWRRKGLPFAAAVVARLRQRRPKLTFCVHGPAATEVQHLFAHWQGGYALMGWLENPDYASFDVLLHPAIAEPYGMVVTEAMAASVPVVVSDACGAATQVTPAAGAVLRLTDTVEAWADAIEQQLCRNTSVPRFVRDWGQVAQEYEKIYQRHSAPQAVPAARKMEFPRGPCDQDNLSPAAAGCAVAPGAGVPGQLAGSEPGAAGAVAAARAVGAPEWPSGGTVGVPLRAAGPMAPVLPGGSGPDDAPGCGGCRGSGDRRGSPGDPPTGQPGRWLNYGDRLLARVSPARPTAG